MLKLIMNPEAFYLSWCKSEVIFLRDFTELYSYFTWI